MEYGDGIVEFCLSRLSGNVTKKPIMNLLIEKSRVLIFKSRGLVCLTGIYG